MSSFGKRIDLDAADETYSAADVAVLGDVVVTAWTYGGPYRSSPTFYLRACRPSEGRLGPMMDLTPGPGYAYVPVHLVEMDNSIWMSVQFCEEKLIKLARLTLDDLGINITWMAEVAIDDSYNCWLARYKSWLVLGTNCGNPGDPSDPDQQKYSQFYLFDQEGMLIDQTAAPIITEPYTEWLDTVVVNQYTDQILTACAVYQSGYSETLWTMPISGTGFGSWTQGPNLYSDYARWITGIGTPGGWHLMSCPRGPAYAEAITLDSSLNRRGSGIVTEEPFAYYDDEFAKMYDICLNAGKVAYTCIQYGGAPGVSGFVFAVGNIDAATPIDQVTTIPKSENWYYAYDTRLAALGDHWAYLVGAYTPGINIPVPGALEPYQHSIWEASADDTQFVAEPIYEQVGGRSTFRRPR